MTSLVSRICKNKECKATFYARQVDINRGWGKYCSKSCKARHQTRKTGVRGPYRQESWYKESKGQNFLPYDEYDTPDPPDFFAGDKYEHM